MNAGPSRCRSPSRYIPYVHAPVRYRGRCTPARSAAFAPRRLGPIHHQLGSRTGPVANRPFLPRDLERKRSERGRQSACVASTAASPHGATDLAHRLPTRGPCRSSRGSSPSTCASGPFKADPLLRTSPTKRSAPPPPLAHRQSPRRPRQEASAGRSPRNPCLDERPHVSLGWSVRDQVITVCQLVRTHLASSAPVRSGSPFISTHCRTSPPSAPHLVAAPTPARPQRPPSGIGDSGRHYACEGPSLTAPRIQRLHRDLKVGRHFGGRCQPSHPGRRPCRLARYTARHRVDEGSPPR
jgi:hypothetical protein